ncbi:MAG: FGGY family carbohydrate kinase [bacterium]
MIALGYDVGSSFVKGSIVDLEHGTVLAYASYPEREMTIHSPARGWAEQHPDDWWQAVKAVTRLLGSQAPDALLKVKAIGISYQMHGLVLVDTNGKPLRPSIIWCDSRAAEIGRRAFQEIGETECLYQLLNSPGNFTASKLRWVKEHEPKIFEQIYKILLPGDYIALRLTGECTTTISGLSEGMFWNFPRHAVAEELLKYYQIPQDLLANLVPSIGVQGQLREAMAQELGLPIGIPVSYRAGDQPNNAFSLRVLEPGEIAATAGTSGVVYAVSGSLKCDPQSRVNAFAHVNHTEKAPHIGVLLCINGTGISNSWIRKLVSDSTLSYPAMNELAGASPIGAKGLVVLPFGNGAERMFRDNDLGARLTQLNFNLHSKEDVLRAVQEGVAFSFHYGIGIMESMEIKPQVMRVGKANMFLSPVFCSTLASVSGISIELYNTDGSQGAARAAAVGAGLVSSTEDAYNGLEHIGTIEPEKEREPYVEAYRQWLEILNSVLSTK